MRCDPVELNTRPRTAGLACKFCGCTDDRACPGGCFWISHDPPVCSACEAHLFSQEQCPASETPALHQLLFLEENSGYCVRCLAGFAL